MRRTYALALGAFAAVTGASGAARAQDRVAESQRVEISHIIQELLSSVTNGTRGRLFDFFEGVELWDAAGEIDRLVGNPWELHDSTSYKLRLLPVRLTYPVYSQLVSQMTRLDDLRGLRIYNVTPDSVDKLAVTFDALAPDRRLDDFGGALLGSFSAREFADLAVFALAQQPFFPSTQGEWDHFKYRLGQNKYALAGGALALGAAFDAGAFASSGRVASSPGKDYVLGWYGGVRSLGMNLRPQLRGGLTVKAPGLELSAGLWERIRPVDTDRRTALEVAMREGWLSRLSRPGGWDAFFEAAFRRVLAAEGGYTGERSTGRVGLFARRPRPLHLNNIIFRSSAELESDLRQTARFVAGFGFEHTRTGLATILQSSRTAVVIDGNRTHESRAGLFMAGTVDAPTQFVVDAMRSDARLVREACEAVTALHDPSPSELDAQLAPLASRLVGYLENRRLAYSLLRWERMPNELHGPLDADTLLEARRLVLERQHALAAGLRDAARRLDDSDRRTAQLREMVDRRIDPDLTDAYVAELDALDRVRRREAERINHALFAFQHYREALVRMAAASPLIAPKELETLPPNEMRRLTAMSTPPLQ